MLRIAGKKLDPRLVVFDKDGTLIVTSLSDKLKRIFDMLGLAHMIHIEPDQQTALDVFKAALGADAVRRDFPAAGDRYHLAVRIHGRFKTAFPGGPPEEKQDKGPAKNMSPYYLDLKNFLPANYLYVRFSDNTSGNANGARVLNALITEEGYPNFYAGGGEPGFGTTGQYPGDQQFLFEKNL